MGAFSLRHDQQRPLVVETVARSHPILRGLPDRWETISEELYELEQVWPQMTPLAQAYSPESKKFHPLIWTNTYGKARVFVTSLGHNTAMIANREYLDLVSRGLLWTSAAPPGRRHASPRLLREMSRWTHATRSTASEYRIVRPVAPAA